MTLTKTAGSCHPRLRSRATAAPLAVLAIAALAACSNATSTTSTETTGEPSDSTLAAPEPPATTAAQDAEGVEGGAEDPATDPAASAHGRVLALGEEFLLADLLALGITPVASTATVPEAGFQGVDTGAVDGVEILSATGLNLEQVAALQPDTIVTTRFWADRAGDDVLAQLGELIVVPDGQTPAEQIRTLGDLLGLADQAAEVTDRLRAAEADAAAAAPDDCIVTLATIFPGPSIAAYVEAAWPLPQAVVDAGCSLDPGASEAQPDRNGRAFLSLEQLELLDGPVLMLFQSSTVPGEDEAVADIGASQRWQALPAVAAGRVVVVDRLGYPGAEGQIRFLSDLAAALR